jgi:hypothetical protein
MKELENFVDSFLAQCSQSNSGLVFLQRRLYLPWRSQTATIPRPDKGWVSEILGT